MMVRYVAVGAMRFCFAEGVTGSCQTKGGLLDVFRKSLVPRVIWSKIIRPANSNKNCDVVSNDSFKSGNIE